MFLHGKALVALSGVLVSLLVFASSASAEGAPSELHVARRSKTDKPQEHVVKAGQSIQQVIASLPNDDSTHNIVISPGHYNEQILINRTGPTHISACTPGTVTIQHDRVHVKNTTGSNQDTAVVGVVNCRDFTLRNIHLINAGTPSDPAPGLALSVQNDVVGKVYNSEIEGMQDVVHCGNDSALLLKDSKLIGTVDVLYGAGLIWSENCEFEARKHGGSISAMRGRKPHSRNGAFFSNCRFTCKNESLAAVAISRPWDEFARVVCLNTYMGKHIRPNGFTPWQPEAPQLEHVFFAEYKSTGPGSFGRNATWPPGTPLSQPPTLEKFVFNLTEVDTKRFKFSHIFSHYKFNKP